MNDIPPAPTCPDCGAPLAADSPQALCPACLLRQALASRTLAGANETSSSLPPPSPDEIADKFPQFEITECLGRGGMGVVYKARQKSLDRWVAIKILAPERVGEEKFAERFAREAQTLARLNHPNIVTVFDYGETGGLFYLVMEFVDGVNLRDLLRDGKLEARQALAIVPPICDALQYAHDKGIVHRDIKPENLLLDKEGRVKVADFGIAKLIEPVDTDYDRRTFPEDEQQRTQAAATLMAGTRGYVAPEQSSGTADHRSDIYALGVVLYEMLTGERPDKDVVAPSKKVLVDVRLDEVVLRALEKKPELRYQQVSEIKTMVETIINMPPETNKREQTMEIQFNCPKCNQMLTVDQSAAGATANCPACSESLVVPAETPVKPISPPAPGMFPPPSFLPAANSKRAKGLAITSLVLGIIGLVPVLGLATGLLGLALGVTALVKRTTSKGVAIAGTAVGGIATLLIPFHISMLIIAVSAGRFTAQSAVCAAHLKTIGLGIASYQEKHNGAYPADLNVLVSEGLISAQTLRCPVHDGPSDGCDYGYAHPVDSQANGMLAWDNPHRAAAKGIDGRNVLYKDLSVRFVTEDDWRREFDIVDQSSLESRPNSIQTAKPRQDIPSGQQLNSAKPSSIAAPRPVPPMTIASAIAALKSTSTRDQREPLQFLAQATIEPDRRTEVIAAVKPLLNDMDNGKMAFQVFANWVGKEKVPDLIDIVKTAPSSSQGKQSMKILSRLGDARAAEPLAACLGELPAARDAKAALASLGSVAKPAVLPLYHHENSGVSNAARELLRGYKATDEEIFAESIKALGRDSTETRKSAIRYLATATLSADQRVEAARAIRPLVPDNDKWVGDSARNAMKKLATKADTDFLLEQLQSTDYATRKFATDMLVDFKEPRAAKPIAALLPDSHETYRAGDALIRLGSIAEPTVIPYLKDNDEKTRKRAAEILGKIGAADSLPALQIAAKDSSFFVRVAAENAIRTIRARSAAGQSQP